MATLIMRRVLWGENVYHCFYIRNLECLSHLCFLVPWWKGHIFQDELKHDVFWSLQWTPQIVFVSFSLVWRTTARASSLGTDDWVSMHVFNITYVLRFFPCVQHVCKCRVTAESGQQRGASLLSSSHPESVCTCARVRVKNVRQKQIRKLV